VPGTNGANAGEITPAASNRRSNGIVWGAETNRYSGGILFINDSRGLMVSTYVLRTIGTNTNWPKWEPFLPAYLAPSNEFCGPVELRDAAGMKVPMLRPEVSSREAYPDTMSYAYLSQPKFRSYNGMAPGDLSLFTSEKDNNQPIKYFALLEYFAIKEPGEYQLTVWPKLYRRSNENRDLYIRIDIPPITVPIQVDRASLKK